MKRTVIVALLILSGCSTDYFKGASIRDISTVLLYTTQHKELVFVRTPCTRADKPLLVSAWVRESDLGNMVVLCDIECNCRLTKKTQRVKAIPTSLESGICR